MGGLVNKTAKDPESSKESAKSAIENKIVSALAKKKIEVGARRPMTFSRVILKVDRLRNVQEHVIKVFKMVAAEKEDLNLDGLHDCMNRLHGEMTRAEVMELFDFVDVDESKAISLKEFWVALSVGYILEAIPSLVTARVAPVPLAQPRSLRKIDSGDRADGNVENTAEHQRILSIRGEIFKNFLDMSAQIRELFNLIVMAYLLFDTEGKGYICKEELGRGLGDSAILDTRWKEMDLDEGGTIDFAEFVFSFTSWIDQQEGLEEDVVEKIEEGDEEEGEGDKTAVPVAVAVPAGEGISVPVGVAEAVAEK